LRKDNGGVILVHYSSIRKEGYKSLLEGQRVSFQIDDGPKDPYANDVIEVDDGTIKKVDDFSW
jgi:CspA family cold shock protein